jgi:serine/threonine protein kinase
MYLSYYHEMYYLNIPQDNVIITDDGRAQINDFGLARILNVDGYDEDDVIRNVRYTAPELMPINLDELYALPTLESDIYSFGILLLQVCLYFLPLPVNYSAILHHPSCSMGRTRISREGCRIIT